MRGMENILTDYSEHPEEVHRLHAALCDLYCRSVEHAAKRVRPDAFRGSDGPGHQTQAMMRAETFDAFLKPYYLRPGVHLKRLGMHFWLHSCGNNTPRLPSFIEAGVDLFHPVQKHTMDEAAIAREYGGRLGFWSGFDVQQLLRMGTPDQVRAEVRHLIDTFDRPDGGMAIAAGTPFENIEPFLDEACVYGDAHRPRW